MGLHCYLAMTAREIHLCPKLPEKIAWMACHFSPYGTGLTGIPEKLPQGSLLIVNDRIPIRNHDSEQIIHQLRSLTASVQPYGVLLDFQNPPNTESLYLSKAVAQALSFPVAATVPYAKEIGCGVLLPPLPLCLPLAQYLSPWKGVPVWLEVATQAQQLNISEAGSVVTPCQVMPMPNPYFQEASYHCAYHWELKQDSAVFTIQRDLTHISKLLQEAESLGVTCGVGLYQELGNLIK